MPLIRDDLRGKLTKSKLTLPASPRNRGYTVNSDLIRQQIGNQMLTRVAHNDPTLRYHPDAGAAGLALNALSLLVTGAPANVVAHNVASYRHPHQVYTAMQHAGGPSGGTAFGGPLRFSADTRNLFDAAAMHIKGSGAPVDQTAQMFNLHPGDLNAHVQSPAFAASENEMFSPQLAGKLDPRTAEMSGRYRANQLTNLLARVRAAQMDAAVKAATLTRESATSAKRNAWRDARDMRLAKSEIQAYKEINPGGTDPVDQVGTTIALGNGPPGSDEFYAPQTNGLMAHGTKQLFERFNDSHANRDSNLFHGSHFFTDNGELATGYAGGYHLGRETSFSQTASSIQDLLHKRANADPRTTYLPGITSNLAQELQRSERMGGNYTVKRLTQADLAALPEGHLMKGLEPDVNPVFAVVDKRSGQLTGQFNWNEQEAQRLAAQARRADMPGSTAPSSADRDEMAQVGNHQQMKKWLKQNRKKWTSGTPEDKQLYEDMHQLTFDNHATREIGISRRNIRRNDPIEASSRYVFGGRTLDTVPNIKLAQLDLRRSLNADDTLTLTERARLLRAYGEIVARNSSGRQRGLGADERYALPSNDPRASTGDLREAGRAWLRSRLQENQNGRRDRGLGNNNLEGLIGTFANDLGGRSAWRVLKRAGFGGIMHKGGMRVGIQGHNVAIVNQAKQIRDPWVDPQKLLEGHKRAGRATIAQLTDLVKEAQQMGVDMSPYLPKEALAAEPNLWDKIYEGRGKDIARLTDQHDQRLELARGDVYHVQSDLWDMFNAVRSLKGISEGRVHPSQAKHHEDDWRYARSNLLGSSDAYAREGSLRTLNYDTLAAKQLRERLKLLKSRQSRM